MLELAHRGAYVDLVKRQAIPPDTKIHCDREAILQATRPGQENGLTVDLLLCREDYKKLRIAQKVGANGPL